MKTIHKYKLEITNNQYVMLPREAKILTVQMQGESLCMWAEVDTEYRVESRNIQIYGTGWDITYLNDKARYIGTVQERSFVWHVYEVSV